MTPHLLNDVFMPLLLKAIATILAALCVAVVNVIRKRVRDQRVAEALAFVTTLTGQAVLAAAEEVRGLKDPLKPGAWTDDEKRRVRDGVIAKVRALGGPAVAVVRRELAGGSNDQLYAVLHDLTEAQVEDLRNRSSARINATAIVASSVAEAAAGAATAHTEGTPHT